jgi:hypothetical protein
MRKKVIWLYLLLVAACGGGGSTSSSSGGGGGSNVNPPAQTERLMIVNSCAYTIWIQQQNMPTGVPSVVELASGASQQWAIPAAGLASTRFWPKKGCDATGENCTIGQSSNPCPTGGCPPPVDSKLEATWGCTLSNPNLCAVNPSNTSQLLSDTYWDMSAVDGYTFPYTATVTGNTVTDAAASCVSANCSSLSLSECPSSIDLSVGNGVTTPAYSALNLNLLNSSGAVIGCYSPCTLLNYPTFGGQNQANTSSTANLYCCPTPPISSAQCNAGPVVSTSYVSRVHTMCNRSVYTYAYDDTNGLRHCSAATQVTVTFGPNCP